jgi:uroporphyrin-III C-methyltransferase/precorrin-2 dehydrogenase/sirohydrochlorin ferrochelatase
LKAVDRTTDVSDVTLLPLFLNLHGRRVLLVGGGPVAAAKLRQLLDAGAEVRVVAPEVVRDIAEAGVAIDRRAFHPRDLRGVWLVVAAAPPEVNRAVARAAEARRVFVNAVDDPANATAFLSGVLRRDGVTVAISTGGTAPGLTALLREALDALLPRDLFDWVAEAGRLRAGWKKRGIAMERRRPLLLEALNRLYGRRSGSKASAARPPATAGSVALVGAGPGDPALLTRKAIAYLRAADLVLYDALVDDRVLAYARRAQRFFVGRRAGRHALGQEAIDALMIRAARRGRRVVRLKGGDPFVFGRGGEEVRALAAAGIQVEVVPGVTSAVAAPALAGIPVTYRGISSAFLVVSGHDSDVFESAVSGIRPGTATIVVLMGFGRGAAVAQGLIDRGWRPATPAAIIVDASLARQQVWRGTLAALAVDPVALDPRGAGTLVVGDVVAVLEAQEDSRAKGAVPGA